MSSTVITGINELVTCDGTGPDSLGVRSNAAVVIMDDTVAWIGAAADAPACDTRIDVGGRALIPGFVDSHSHLVFAGDRGLEFAARMTGRPYDGGGIGVTVAATRAASDAELRRLLAARIAELRSLGTTTIEIKSGYGLTVADEVRALKIARDFSTETTFLGAHVVPAEYARGPCGLCRSGDADRCWKPLLRTRAGSMSSASRTPHMPSMPRKLITSSRQEPRPGLVCECMAISWDRDPAFSWLWSWARRVSITAPFSMTPMSTRSRLRRRRRLPRCCPASSSALALPIPMPHGCSLRGSRSRWRPIAILEPATRARSRG